MLRARSTGSRASIALALVLLFVAACSGARDDLATHQHQLEERLLAPCCWRQNLADHESPVATTLRGEIRERLARGETPASVEADFVRRYGDQIRALPAGGDPRWIVGTASVGVAVLALIGLGWFISRRRAPRTGPVSNEALFEGEYADRLDDELLAVD